MSRYLSPRLLQPGHALNGQCVDVVVEDGRIASIVPSKPGSPGADDRDLTDCWISAGWWDAQADFRDPGTDRAEGLANGLAVAAQGGFTRVAPVASTVPCRDQPSEVISLRHRAADSVCGVLPVAALSIGRDGLQLSEAYALKAAGALAFSDDAPVRRPEMLRRALEYHAPSGLAVFSDAHDPHFQPDGVMHEGAMSTSMGLAGCSEESELLRIGRDLDILRYTGGRLHFPIITSAAGLRAVLDAKRDGLKVSCGTSIHHLVWTDGDLAGFNSDLKVMPPLRSEADRLALRQAALDGSLDVVVSDHRPRTPEEHDVDFMVVKPGIAGLHAVGPALFGALTQHGATEREAMEAMHALLVAGPRRLFMEGGHGLSLAEGEPAEFTVFSPQRKGMAPSASKAPNTVYVDGTAGLTGQVIGVVTPRGGHWN